jgi:hypothetical protein
MSISAKETGDEPHMSTASERKTMADQHRKRRNVPMRADDQIKETIEETIQALVKKGLVVDSGQRRWNERTGRYENVWIATEYLTRH